MNTHAKIGCLGLFAVTLFTGCLASLNPVYKDEQLVVDDSALGSWVQPDSKASWVLSKRDARSYTLVYTDEQGHQGRFVARLAKIEGTMFLDLFPEQAQGSANGLYNLHQVPIHTIYLVKRTKPNLELASIDFNWLQKHLSENPQAIAHAIVGEGKLITAPTDDVQDFVLAHKGAFTNEFKLTRPPKPAN
jgi:hypothetical protein